MSQERIPTKSRLKAQPASRDRGPQDLGVVKIRSAEGMILRSPASERHPQTHLSSRKRRLDESEEPDNTKDKNKRQSRRISLPETVVIDGFLAPFPQDLSTQLQDTAQLIGAGLTDNEVCWGRRITQAEVAFKHIPALLERFRLPVHDSGSRARLVLALSSKSRARKGDDTQTGISTSEKVEAKTSPLVQILQAVAQGRTNQQIADETGLELERVGAYVRKLYRHYGVNGHEIKRAEKRRLLCQRAVQQGDLPPETDLTHLRPSLQRDAPRLFETLQHLAVGKTKLEIAKEMKIRLTTLRGYIRLLHSKLEVDKEGEDALFRLIDKARSAGFIPENIDPTSFKTPESAKLFDEFELPLLPHLAKGLTNRQIAQKIGEDEDRVKWLIYQMNKRHGIDGKKKGSRQQLVKSAIDRQALPDTDYAKVESRYRGLSLLNETAIMMFLAQELSNREIARLVKISDSAISRRLLLFYPRFNIDRSSGQDPQARSELVQIAKEEVAAGRVDMGDYYHCLCTSLEDELEVVAENNFLRLNQVLALHAHGFSQKAIAALLDISYSTILQDTEILVDYLGDDDGTIEKALANAVEIGILDKDYLVAKYAPLIKRLDLLTPKEKRIVAFVAKGMINRNIGDQLTIPVAECTVSDYFSRIYQKLKCTDRKMIGFAYCLSGREVESRQTTSEQFLVKSVREDCFDSERKHVAEADDLLAYHACGLSYQEIADALNIAKSAVKRKNSRLFRFLGDGVNTIEKALYEALRQGILDKDRLTVMHQDIIARLDRLSEREAQVLELLATGLNNREITKQLDPPISISTVCTHIRNIYTKLESNDRRVAALAWNLSQGI